MDTNTILLTACLVLLIACLAHIRWLYGEIVEMRLDIIDLTANVDETHGLLVDMALEDAPEPLLIWGTGNEEYTWTETTNHS